MRYRWLVVVFLVIALVCWKSSATSLQAQTEQDLIRLHIIANSNTVVDQAIKLKVRNRILKELKHNLPKADNSDSVKKWLKNNLEAIEVSVAEELQANNISLAVRAEYGEFLFPQKKYPFGILGAGTYRSLRVFLGEGKGRNWWCVLYPPLCLLSTEASTVEKADDFQEFKIEFRLALWEKWQGKKLQH